MLQQLELPGTNARRVYVLGTYTVERRQRGWYFWNTYNQDKKDAKGPYTTPTSVCLMVARALVREVNKRDAKYALPE